MSREVVHTMKINLRGKIVVERVLSCYECPYFRTHHMIDGGAAWCKKMDSELWPIPDGVIHSNCPLGEYFDYVAINMRD